MLTKYMTNMRNLAAIFVSCLCMAITCEVNVVIGSLLVDIYASRDL